MPQLLTTATVMLCPHGGQVQITSSNTHAKVDGNFIIRPSDTFLIAGCAFNISGTPHPCTSIQWTSPASNVMADGDHALSIASTGLCIAADQAPQGAVIIASTQPHVAGV